MNYYTQIKYFPNAILYYIAKFEDGRIKINFARPIFVKKVKKIFFLGINKKKNVEKNFRIKKVFPGNTNDLLCNITQPNKFRRCLDYK